jgi:hypothetical protein
MPEEFPTEADVIRAAKEMTDELRNVGLYEDSGFHFIEGRLVASFYLGDVAFSSRVQDPGTFDMNQAFAEMMAEERRRGFHSPSLMNDLDRVLKETERKKDGE